MEWKRLNVNGKANEDGKSIKSVDTNPANGVLGKN